MTCFWKAILDTLNLTEKQILGLGNNANEYDLVYALKDKSYFLLNAKVKWQNEVISEQLCGELKQWIDAYETENISEGHDTSSCDPFLTLLCELFGWNIVFNYQFVRIYFENMYKTTRTVTFGANSFHFYV